MEDKVLLQKIPIKVVIDILLSLKENGANYFDILVSRGEIQDGFGIFVKDEYYESVNKPLSEEDINNLTDE